MICPDCFTDMVKTKDMPEEGYDPRLVSYLCWNCKLYLFVLPEEDAKVLREGVTWNTTR